MTTRSLVLLATLGSAAMLLGAFGFQYIGELAPCKMCLWQRWPHGAAILIGALAWFMPNRWLYALGALAALTTASIGFFHAGVELQWWEGPTTCTSQSIAGLSTEDLLNQIMAAPVVRCDEVAWSMFGLSMAAWNGLISLGLAGLWLIAARKG